MTDLATTVRDLLIGCLFADEDLVDGKLPREPIITECVVQKFGFDPLRVQERREAILAVVKQIVKDKFYQSKGGGWSFLELPFTREDEQWGEHRNAEDLLALGMAIGVAGFCCERHLWPMLPGGMPYVWFEP